MPLNISIDVDLTLIGQEGQLLLGAKEAILKLQSVDCQLTLWSLAGAKYAKAVAEKHGIEHLFVGFAGKPDIAIDDDLNSFNPRLKFEMRPDTEWAKLVVQVMKQVQIFDGKDSDHESRLALVNDCKIQLKLLQNKHGYLFPPDLCLQPVPFFGNPFQAEVLTMALNPSFTEFNPGRGWGIDLDVPTLIEKLLPYFKNSPHVWFNQLEKALLYFGSSYETNTAHVDLFPHPTWRPRDMGNDQKRELAGLIRLNTSHLQHVLKLCRSVKLIIIIDFTFRFDQGRQLSVFSTLQEFIPAAAQNNGQTLPTICFPNPNSIGEWAFNNRSSLRKHLREAEPIEF